MPAVYAATAAGRALLRLLQDRAAIIPCGRAALDETIPPTLGLSAAYGCTEEGCSLGDCPCCSALREWGARCVCTDCGCPLELWPDQFTTRPQCGDCAGASR